MLEYKDYIYAAYTHRNFSKAAQAVHVSQPWFSSAIKKTEQELNTRLFDRSTTPISLTNEGRYYIEQVERIMEIEEEMRQHYSDAVAETGRKLRIGSSMFFCTYVLPEIGRSFSELYPEIQVILNESNTTRLEEKLINKELDIIFEVEQIRDKRITTVPWMTEEIVLAVPSWYEINNQLSEYRYSFSEFLSRDENDMKPGVPLDVFRDENFLLLNSENDLHDRSIRLCKAAGFRPRVRFELTQLMTAYYLVCEGQGVSFIRSTIPEHVVPTDDIVFYRIDDELATRSIYFSYIEDNQSDIAGKYIEYLNSYTEYDTAF